MKNDNKRAFRNQACCPIKKPLTLFHGVENDCKMIKIRGKMYEKIRQASLHISMEKIVVTWWNLNTYIRLENLKFQHRLANEVESLVHWKILDGDDDGCLAAYIVIDDIHDPLSSFSKTPKSKWGKKTKKSPSSPRPSWSGDVFFCSWCNFFKKIVDFIEKSCGPMFGKNHDYFAQKNQRLESLASFSWHCWFFGNFLNYGEN